MGLPSITPYSMPKASDLPKNKVAWELDSRRAALLIHDMQHYFINAYDANQSPISELIQNIVDVRSQCKELGIPVIYTAQPGNQDPADRALLQDFWGKGLSDDESVTSILEDLAPDNNDIVLTKWRYSAFQRTNLLDFLQTEGRDQLMICGIYAHIGCLITAADAFMYDVKPFFLADAVADFSEEDHQMAMNYVAKRCGVTMTTNQLLHALKTDQAAQGGEHPISLDALRQRVAQYLDLPSSTFSDNHNLVDLGLDSIRLMSLVEELREKGIDVDFMTLAETPTLTNWWSIISASSDQYV